MKMKKMAILSLMVGSLLLSGCSCSAKKDNDEKPNDNKNDQTNVITDENVVGEQNIDGIVFENTTFQIQNGVTTIVTKVTNKTDADYQLDNYQMSISDNDGMILTILTSTVDDTLAAGEEKVYTTPFTLDLSKAAKVDYAVNVKVEPTE